VLFPNHLPISVRIPLAKANVTPAEPSPTPPGEGDIPQAPGLAGKLGPLRDMRDAFEKAYMAELVRQADGDIEAACRISGLSRPHVYATLKKHDLKLR